MIEFYPLPLDSTSFDNIPLNHDCVLKVYYQPFVGLPIHIFSCRAQDSGSIVDIISKLFCVSKVEIISL